MGLITLGLIRLVLLLLLAPFSALPFLSMIMYTPLSLLLDMTMRMIMMMTMMMTMMMNMMMTMRMIMTLLVYLLLQPPLISTLMKDYRLQLQNLLGYRHLRNSL